MAFLKTLRPLVAIAAELRRIAICLEYFAAADARTHGRMFLPNRKRRLGLDQSELLHSDPTTIQRLKSEERDLLIAQGYSALEAGEAVED